MEESRNLNTNRTYIDCKATYCSRKGEFTKSLVLVPKHMYIVVFKLKIEKFINWIAITYIQREK